MRYTIEARELTTDYRNPAAYDANPRRTEVEARDADDAISQFVRQSHSELISLLQGRGRESIATVKKDDSVFLVRVYSA